MTNRQAAQETRNIAVCAFLTVTANEAIYAGNVAFSTISTKTQADSAAAVTAGTNAAVDNTGYEAGWFEVMQESSINTNKLISKKADNNLSDIEVEVIDIFRKLPNDEERSLAIETMRLRVNAISNGRSHTPARKKA